MRTSNIIRDSIQKIAFDGGRFCKYMTRFPIPSTPQRLLRLLTAVVAAAALPNYVLAQSAPAAAKLADRDAPSVISAEQLTGRPDRELELDRKVDIERGGTRVNAARAKFHVVEDEVDAFGGVRLTRDGNVYTGDELKLIFPQPGAEPERYAHLPFQRFFLQPMDGPARAANTALAVRYCLLHPQWRLSLQTHKLLGIP